MAEIWLEKKKMYLGKVICFDEKDYTLKNSRNILFQLYQTTSINDTCIAIDALYQSPDYIITDIYEYDEPIKVKEMLKVMNKEEIKSIQNRQNICIAHLEPLKTLLDFLGFPAVLRNKECLEIYNNLLNGKFAYENCALFGYQKLASPELNPYAIKNYQCIEKTKLTPYFEVLNQIDYHNPEACFEPFEEEGQIRKRML